MTALPTWLFVSYGGGHVNALLPVAQRVRALGLARPVYLALTTAAPAVRQAGIDMLGFRDLLQPGDVRARGHGERMAAQLQVPAADHEESVAYLGLSYADLEDRLGAEPAARAYAQYGRQAFLPLSAIERVFDRVQPALVVATNSPRAEEAAILTARRRGVPSACLLDLFGQHERERLARPDFADALCVLNEPIRQTFIAAGRPAAQVHVTGNPAFDTVNDPAMREQGRALRHEAGWDRLHVLLYASSPEPVHIPDIAGTGDPELPRRLERALIDAVERDPGLALWVRRHPSEPVMDDPGHARIRVSTRAMPLHACLHASDEVFVTVSTVGVEASLAGKPVTQLRGSILDHLSPYAAMGIAQRESGERDIAQALKTRPVAVAAPQAPGAATQRVTDVLRQLQEATRGH
ncbi:UDP-glycosyltransferase [Ramlibacter humi]|uniref:UDP-glycosyltransferase n=1 Tax=Ramlibacter humi TaxID=2530451 RepID=A0A4Z0C0M2_9BURK|nr:UDP-glycosyltransferase [Ramlibacter humi]TFZ04070.1 UDP-glycosyltransferase [Ramlibacter humi]